MEQKDPKSQPQPTANTERRPDETGSISVEGFVKIHDPNSKEVFVEKRA